MLVQDPVASWVFCNCIVTKWKYLTMMGYFLCKFSYELFLLFHFFTFFFDVILCSLLLVEHLCKIELVCIFGSGVSHLPFENA